MNVLAVDVGGSHVKILTSNATVERRFDSGPEMTADIMVAGVKALIADWKFEAVTIGYPGPVLRDRVVGDPHNLASGWIGYDFSDAFGCPVKVMNDAAMQALGSYEGGKLLFLGLGTGLGTTLILDGTVVAMELGHLPYKKHSFEDYIGERGLERRGRKKWRADVGEITARLIHALMPEDVVLGGGNVRHLGELPPGCRLGDNANAFLGGFRAWDPPKRK